MRHIGWKLVNCCISVQKMLFEKTCNARLTFKVTHCHQNCRYLIGCVCVSIYLVLVCGNKVSILYLFRDIATFIVYLTACDPKVLRFRYDSWNCNPSALSEMCAGLGFCHGKMYFYWGSGKTGKNRQILEMFLHCLLYSCFFNEIRYTYIKLLWF